MKKIKFTVLTATHDPANPKELEWTGYTTEVPGLIVHRAIGRNETPGDYWVVTHGESGMSIPHLQLLTRRDALAAAGELQGMTDWSRSIDEIKASVTPESRRTWTSQVLAISRRYDPR